MTIELASSSRHITVTVNLGDEAVILNSNYYERPVLVEHVTTNDGHRFKVSGRLLRKDGTPGNQETTKFWVPSDVIPEAARRLAFDEYQRLLRGGS